jgi:hypothetical protein
VTIQQDFRQQQPQGSSPDHPHHYHGGGGGGQQGNQVSQALNSLSTGAAGGEFFDRADGVCEAASGSGAIERGRHVRFEERNEFFFDLNHRQRAERDGLKLS